MNDSKIVHIRRCHACGGVSERLDDRVEHCDHCGKNLAPYYFFDESCVRVYSDVEERPDVEKRCARGRDLPDDGSRQPLRGFSTFW